MTAGRSNQEQVSHHWGTPPEYISLVRKVFGGVIDLDPCSNIYSKVDATTSWSLPEQDGLRKIWNYKRIFVNPPYGADRVRGTRIRDWLQKCYNANVEFDAEVIALVPIAANTLHWKRYVWPVARSVCFLYDTRLKFLENGRATGKGAPMACCMVYWGSDFEAFAEVFKEKGTVVDLEYSVSPTGFVESSFSLAAE